MESKVRKALRALVFILICLPLVSLTWAGKLGYTATGYEAKVMCSSVFISGRSPEDVEKNDLLYTRVLPVKLRVNRDKREVTATVYGGHENRAVYRDGLGCTLVVDASDEQLAAQAEAAPAKAPPLSDELPWPRGNAAALDHLPPDTDRNLLESALDYAFTGSGPKGKPGTRAVVVVYRGKIIAERYAPGFAPDMPLLGWSMTKSVTNALVGILVKQGKLDIYAPAPVPEWQSPGDPRAEITLDQLLRMSSGLKWTEVSADADLFQMMFTKSDTAAYAASQPPTYPPDTVWYYSSGTANVISGIVRRAVGGDEEYFAFPYRELFHKLGMNTAALEPDASGTFVGSSYLYATARDWARFGQLYLQDGVWNGERILPEGWVAYSVTPTPPAPQGGYGAQWWLNAGSAEDPADRPMPELPADIYSAQGLDGQFVTVIPSHQLVVVRLGLTPIYKNSWDHQKFLKPIIESVSAP